MKRPGRSSTVSYATLEPGAPLPAPHQKCHPDVLALRAYRQGFHDGADPMGARRRHQVDPATHDHWRAGFQEGRRAAEAAETEYGMMLAGRL